MKKILFLSGPTAVGKSNLAIDLAIKFNLEIISADSIQVYKYFNIGSAKPNNEELNKVKHHLIDFVNPWASYNNSNFIVDAKKAIDLVYKNNKYPIIVGGTGFYINSLIYGSYNTPVSDYNIKKQLEEEYDKDRIKLYNELKKIDPSSALNFHYNDRYRTIRALEIYYTSKKTLTEYKLEHKLLENYKYLIIFISSSLSKIKENIKLRTNKMLELGLIEEVKNLLNDINIKNTKPMKSIAYKELSLYLDNKISLDDAIALINKETYKLAKRQITWFKKRTNVIFVDQSCAYNTISNIINDFYSLKGY